MKDLLADVSSAPIFDGVDLGPKPKRAIGGLHDHGIIFRQPPSPEVDEAWSIAALDHFEVINVTKADIIAAGEDPEYASQWDPEVDSYPVEIEFSHKVRYSESISGLVRESVAKYMSQIHCLDQVRKSIWGDHYWGENSIHADDRALARGDYKNDDEGLYDDKTGEPSLKGERRIRRYHTMHCLHMILQDLQCNADVGIVPIVWTRGEGPNAKLRHINQFSTLKQCRDIDAAMKWVRDNAVKGANEGHGTLKYHAGTRVFKTNDGYDP